VLFQPADQRKIETMPEYEGVRSRFHAAHEQRKKAAFDWIASGKTNDANLATYREAQKQIDASRKEASKLAGGAVDTNYIFLSFVIRYLPHGVVGLIIAVIFAAAMSVSSGEVNSLATVTVMDMYRPIRPDGTDNHYLWASRGATVFWGMYAVAFASFGRYLGSLIEAVNIVGSLFYGGMLGVFILAFFVPRSNASGAFWGVLAGEIAIFSCFLFTKISFLWYNVIGCLVVVAVGVVLSWRNPAAGNIRPA
jgi:Na+/proline symporter